jgi:putative CocE/NonD family hydrolase
MKDGRKPDFLKKRVAYYVVGPGAECWKYADDLEAIASEKRLMYLHSNGTANDAFSSGTLGQGRPLKEIPDHYTYDPLDTRPAEVEREAVEHTLIDQRAALNLFGNGVVYHSEPFAEATEISGYAKFTCWMAMDVPDTDFQVTIFEIMPDGTSVLLTQDLMRARYRESLRQEKLVKPGEINRFEFKSFNWFSRRVSKGSRLRLLLKSPNSYALQKNYNSGGVVADESAKDARTAHITVYHDAQHPSVIELPVVR